MYNGIGLQTPRGSGTSGHIQSNISMPQHKPRNRDDFLKQLQAKRNAVAPPPRKANPEIIEHERNRDILIQTLKLRAKLESEGIQESEIVSKLNKAKQVLKTKFEKGQIQAKGKDTHILTQAKEREYKKLSQAFGLSHQPKKGSAFNFQHQRETRLISMQQKRVKTKFECPHATCAKTYDCDERLKRHLKYKHIEIKKLEQVEN